MCEKTLIYKHVFGKGETTILKADIKDGELVIEGYDTGETVKEAFGDWDYEYWIKADVADCPEDILNILKNNFNSSAAIMHWMKDNDIKYTFTSF